MELPQQRVKVFYFRNPAYNFKSKMEEYRKKHNLPDTYAPKMSVQVGARSGKHKYDDIYTVTYYEYTAKQLRPEYPIHKIIVQARKYRDAQNAFYRLTKDNTEVTFVRAIKRDKIPNSPNYEWIVEWRKAIYRKHKSHKWD